LWNKQAFVVIQDRLAGGMQKAVGDLPVTAVRTWLKIKVQDCVKFGISLIRWLVIVIVIRKVKVKVTMTMALRLAAKRCRIDNAPSVHVHELILRISI